MNKTIGAFLLALVLLPPAAAQTRDVVRRLPIGQLVAIEGAIPDGPWSTDWSLQRRAAPARVVVDAPAEAYLTVREGGVRNALFRSSPGEIDLVVRAPEGTVVTGMLAIPGADWTTTQRVRFRVDPERAVEVPESEFLAARAAHYRSLLRDSVPGAAWFRHHLGGADTGRGRGRDEDWRRERDMDETIAFFSGGRAIGENLQLDRLIPLPGEADTDSVPVALADLEGVTTRGIDWAPYLEGAETRPDRLASLVPHDQYAVFFPDFASLVAVADAAVENGALALHVTEARAENALTRERYERQLGVSLDALTRALGGPLVRSVAMTGSDPYLRTGSDVALVFEPVDAAALETLLAGRIQAAMGALQPVAEDGARVWRTVDRVRSAYLARVGKAVVLANSPVQLARLRSVAAGGLASLSSLDEYRFFRARYPAGAEDESALVLLPDPAIRKWCGPRWRIAASRRVRALARLADDHARYADVMLAAEGDARVVLPEVRDSVDLGARMLVDRQVRSSVYGTLDFLTPIAELEFDRVSGAEAQLYERWRQGYQRNWSNFFDPVALRLDVADGSLAADVTVMPLIGGSDYREFVELARGGKIAPDSGDRHPDRLLHWALALDRDSRLFKQSSNWLATMGGLGGSPFDWLGDSVSLQVEPGAYWDDLRAAEDLDDFFLANLHRLPVAVRAEVAKPMKATMFLTAVRTFIEQAAPKMTVWEAREHAGQAYVRVGPSENAVRMEPDVFNELALYYALLPDSLTVTFDEDLLKRALERGAARQAAAEDPAVEAPPAGAPLLGDHLCMQVDLRLPEILMSLRGSEMDYVARLQGTCWDNLPILNEYKRMWPDRDPVAVHERLFGTRLMCPAGGRYVWNERWKTMESTALGHPWAPKVPEPLPVPFGGWKRGNFGLTFEADGLRARAHLSKRIN